MNRMDKKLEKLMNELLEEFTRSSDNENKKNIKKELKKIADEFDDSEVMFASRSKCYIQGSRIAIEALLYALLKQMNEENHFTVKELTEIFIQAVAMDDGFKKVDKDVISDILKQINKMI